MSPKSSGKNVLIVDDDNSVCRIVQRMLSEQYQARLANLSPMLSELMNKNLAMFRAKPIPGSVRFECLKHALNTLNPNEEVIVCAQRWHLARCPL